MFAEQLKEPLKCLLFIWKYLRIKTEVRETGETNKTKTDSDIDERLKKLESILNLLRFIKPQNNGGKDILGGF